MRILLCSMTYPPHTNGQAVFTQNLAQGLAMRGHEVMVVTSAERHYPRKSLEQGIQCFRLPAINLACIHQDLQVPVASGYYIPALIRQFHPQVVHLQDPSPLCLRVLHEARRLNIPVIISHHSGPEISAPFIYFKNARLHQLTNAIIWKILRAYLQQADLVTVPSRYSVSMLKEHGVHEKVRTVPGYVDLTDFRPMRLDAAETRKQYGLAAEKRIFLYAGRVDPEKKVNILIEAMASLKREDVQLAIAGAGSQLEHLKHQVQRLGLQDKVKFLGQVDHAQLPGLMNCADFFIMPGDVESFSIATLEAMACAKPVLAACATALPELVTHSENGYLFRPSDPADIVYYMEKLLQSQEQWADMGHASALKARQFNQEAVLKAYEETLREVTSQKNNTDVHRHDSKVSLRNWRKSFSP